MLSVSVIVFLAYIILWYVSHRIAPHILLPKFGTTQAEVMVGLIGVFLGFGTLSVQLHAGNTESESSITVPFVVRTHWLYLNWGFGLGVIVANVAAVTLLDVGFVPTLHGVSVANFASALILALLIGRFLYVTARDAGTLDISNFVLITAPRAVAERVEISRRTNAVHKAFGINTVYPFVSANRVEEIEVRISPSANHWFTGINATTASVFIDELQSGTSQNFRVKNIYIPIEDDGDAVLVLTPEKGKEPEEDIAPVFSTELEFIQDEKALDENNNSLKQEMERRFRKVLIEGLREDHQSEILVKALRNWQISIIRAAGDGNSGELDKWLDQVTDLIRMISGNKVLDEILPTGRMSFSVGDPPLWIDIHAVVDAALNRKNPLQLDSLISFLLGVSMIGKNQDDLSLVDHALGVLQYIHYQSHPRQSNGSEQVYRLVEKRIDSILDSNLSMLYWSKSKEHESDRKFLAFGLAVTKAAIELGETDAASSYAGRFQNCFRETQPGLPFKAPEEKRPQDEAVLAIIALSGWCISMLERVEKLPSRQDAAQAVLDTLVYPISDSRYLIWIWETHGGIGRESVADVRLLLGHWDPDYETDQPERTRNAGAHIVDESWGLKGLLNLMYKAGTPIGHLGQFFTDPPTRHLWNKDSVESAIQDLSRVCGYEPHSTPFPEITEMLWRRERWGKAVFAKQSVQSPVDESDRVKEMIETIKEAETTPYQGYKSLKGLHVSESDEVVYAEDTIKASMNVPRDYFVQGSSWMSGMGELLRDGLLKQTSMSGFWKAEQSIDLFRQIEDEDQVRNAVDDAIQSLKEAEFHPDIVLIPRRVRPDFVQLLFGKGQWQLENRDRSRSLYIGREDGLSILFWPYTNTKSIILAEASKLFGFRLGKSPVSVEWKDCAAEERNSLLDEIERELELVKGNAPIESDPPDTSGLKVKFKAEQQSRLGVLDPAAARRIDIESLLNDDST